jgi:TonB family protein
MAARNKPYEQFGPYILYKKLEADALGDLWRAGRIEGGELGATVALRRLSGGRREALLASTHAVSNILPRLSGASFVRDQHAGREDGIPFLTWEYAGGRSLRHVIARARGGEDSAPNPLPIDQAIAIAEKIALSLATMADFRETSGGRLSHGALIPHFVWITDEGEIRVAAQQIGPGLIASLDQPEVAAEIGRYFPPEYRSSGRVSRDTDVYSMGAILFLIVSGQEPPDPASSSAFGAAVSGARTMSGEAIPDDIRTILDRSLTLDSAMRFPAMGEMKQALSSLAGKYSATTFNLAFYLSTLLKKEMEAEAIERTREAKISVGPYLETAIRPATPAASPAPALPPPVMFANTIEKPKTRMPLMLSIAALALAAAGAGGYLMIARQTKAPDDSRIAAAQIATAPPPQVISEPVMASPEESDSDMIQDDSSLDPEAQKRAFDEAVRQKLQAEMMKLQSAFLADLQQKQPSSAPAPVSSSPAPAASTNTLSPEEAATLAAAQLEQQRRDAQLADTAEQRPAASQPIAQTAQAPASATPSSAAPAQTPVIREGDLVEVSLLDSMPRPTRPIRPVYPPLAARQKIAATIILTAFLTEDGDVTDVRVLRGDPRYGLNDAAIRAMRATKFTPPMKDGKHVRTWFPQTIEFNPN